MREQLRPDDYECSVCQLLLHEPVALSCGHAFCRACIERTLRYVRARATAARPQPRVRPPTPTRPPSARPPPQDDKCALCREPLLLPPDAFLGGWEVGVSAEPGGGAEPATGRVARGGLRVCLPLAELLASAFPAEAAARAAEAARLAADPSSALPAAAVLDLFVLDASLPAQSLFLNVHEPRYLAMCRRLLSRAARPPEERLFGMVGYAPLRSPPAAPFGVAMAIVEAQGTYDGRMLVKALALRRFRVCRAWQEGREAAGRHAGAPGIVRAVVELLDDEPAALADGSAARAAALAAEVAEACGAWLRLVRAGGWERSSGQLAALLSADAHAGGIGPMPPPPDHGGLLGRAAWASALSWWAAALVNPLPPLGVAPEIRPQALAALGAEERLAVVLGALEESCAFLSTPPPALALARAAERALLRPAGALGSAAAALGRRWLGLERRSWLSRHARRCVGAVGLVATLAGGRRALEALGGWLGGGQAAPGCVAAVLAMLRI